MALELDVVIKEMIADSRFRMNVPSTQASTAETPAERARREAQVVLDLAEKASLPEALHRLPFDDLSNRRFVDQAGQVFRDFKMQLSDVSQYLFQQHRNAELSGARLELLARLASGHLHQLIEAVNAPKQ